MDRVKVKNAADENQVKKAQHAGNHQRDRDLNDLKILMSEPHGRRFILRILEVCGTWRSIWHPSAAIHMNAGKQDIGHFIMGELATADHEALTKLMIQYYKDQGENK